MEQIIARWEWRTFGVSLPEAEAAVRKHPAGAVRESSETYILSRCADQNTKIRDLLMDIKELQQVNADKLEQWSPVMKAQFPLSRSVLAEVGRAWNVTLPRQEREEYTHDQFLAEIVGKHPDLKAVAVFKERHGFTINDCIVEIAYLKFDGAPIHTVAVEMADPARVTATVRELRLEGYENINYVCALKRHAVFGTTLF